MPATGGSATPSSERILAALEQANESNRLLAAAISQLQNLQTGTVPGNPGNPTLPKFNEDEDFEDFVMKFEAVAEVYAFSDAKKIATFVTQLPASIFQLLRNLLHPEHFKDVTFTKIKDTLTKHLKPKPLVIPSRHAFLQRKQQEGESLADFMAALRKLAVPCNYSDAILQTMLRDVFVAGVRSRTTLDRLFEEDDTDLDKLYKIAMAIEQAERSTQDVLHSQFKQGALNDVKFTGNRNAANKGKNEQHMNQQQERAGASYQSTSGRVCFACGDKSHIASDCSRKSNLVCNFCNTQGHLEVVCRKKKATTNPQKSRKPRRNELHNIGGDDEPPDTFNVYSVNNNLREFKPWVIRVTVAGVPVSMEVDSGSGASFCSDTLFKKFRCPMEQTSVEFHPYGEGTPRITPLGCATVTVEYKGRRAQLPIYVLAGECVPLIGRQWLEALNILKQEDLHRVAGSTNGSTNTRWDPIQLFPELFTEGIGLAKNYTCSITMKPDAQPVFRKARPVPFALRDRIEAELDRLVQEGVLEATQYSEYATPIVPVIQKDSIRICADYSTTVNPQLEIPRYPLPRLEELLSSISGCKIFAKLDIRKAYLSLPLDAESSSILTINTHKGLFQPKRLMFGCASAPVIWTRYMERVVQGIEGLAVFFDDLLLGAETHDALREKLAIVLQRLQENGLRLNLPKCRFFVESVQYLGHEISAKGISKTKERVQDILTVPTPTSIREVRAFLGMVSFYGRYFPDMATVAAPLYEATKGTKLRWTRACDAAFQNLKQELTSDRVLAHYSPSLPVSLCCDASPVAIGAVLQHTYPDGSERPILYIHKKLDSTQVNYSQLDKEALSLKWAVEKLHHYLIGREFTLYTDHRPLVHIFGKQRSKLPPLCATRLLHYALFLQNFTFTIKYRKSSDHGNADFMSRLPTHSTQLGVPDTLEEFQVQHISVLPHSPKEIAAETLRDPELRELLDKLRRGESIPGQDGNYSLQSGCILRGLRVYIPHAFRPAILEELHAGHLGIVKVKALARSLVYWKNIDTDIENMCKNCTACALHKGRPVKTSTHYWEYPANAWERLHMDFAFYGGKYYLLIVDAHSKWPEIFITPDMASTTVMNVLESLFSRYGLPLTVVSDNQSSFVGRDIQQFYKKYGIKHVTSPPYHAASNGQAERFVSSMKQCLRTLQHSPGTAQQKLYKFLAAYRRAPHITTGVSPASLFLKRELRTTLDLARPNIVNEINDKRRKNQLFMKHPVFQEGQTVAVRSFSNPLKKWTMGTVIARDGDLQWTVLVDGELTRRHSDHLRSVAVESSQSSYRQPVTPREEPVVTPSPGVGATTQPTQQHQPQVELTGDRKVPEPQPQVASTPAPQQSRRSSVGVPQSASSASFGAPPVMTSVVPATPPLAQRRGRRQVKQPERLDL